MGSHKLGRRAFLKRAGVGSAIAAAAPAAPLLETSVAAQDPLVQRRNSAFQCRLKAAEMARTRPLPIQTPNGDESRYRNRIASFSKGLPHNALGEVDTRAYAAMIDAVVSGDPNLFEAIPMGGPRKLVSPQASLAFDLEGADCGSLALPPFPALASAEAAAELIELYWMALARDVAFVDYERDPIIAAACAELSSLSAFRGPRQGGQVTPATIFRGHTRGDLIGPYLSQFLWLDIPMGALRIPQTVETTVPGLDFLTNYDEWLASQNGQPPLLPNPLDGTLRYMRNLRDIAQWVHVDALYQAYHQACLILLPFAAFDRGIPYSRSVSQEGFATFGGPHILSLVTEVATRALKAAWFQKWQVHRVLRPEAMGGLVHQQVSRMADRPVHETAANSAAVARTRERFGTALLPQAFAEGTPLHPSYPSGHATVAGACVTILKAWFDEDVVITNPVEADPSGLFLRPYTGPALTVGHELDKLASNVAAGRNAAGIHYRSDYWEGAKLGEQVALTILQEQKDTYNERVTFSLTLFDGTRTSI